MPDKRLIQEKLAEILKQLGYLEKLAKLSVEDIFGKASNLYFAERVMERMIGAAIDINMHIASDLAGEVPKDYFNSFLVLARLRILTRPFAKKIAASTSLRNILIHEYMELDEKKFKKSLQLGLKDYMRYARAINRYLKKHVVKRNIKP